MTDETNGSGAGERRCCLDDKRDHTPTGCTRCGCLTPVWIAGAQKASLAAPDADDASEHELLANAKCRCGAEHDARGTGESGEAWYARHILDPDAASTDASGALSEALLSVRVKVDGMARLYAGSDGMMPLWSDDDPEMHAVHAALLPWLTARESAAATRARAEERERIARAIEANWSGDPLFDLGVEDCARIARGDA